MLICRPCIGLGCDNPPDLASGINSAIYSAIDYSFIVECPDNCYCPPGLFPQTISILASTIPPVIPPTPEPGSPIVLRLQGCQSLITRTLDPNASQDDIEAAAQAMQAEWAGQQANCNALLLPGVNCTAPAGDKINLCNDAQNICCPGFGPVFVPAGQFCDTLITTGLSAAQIIAATASLRARLNSLARDQFCPAFGTFCSIVETSGPSGGAIILINCHNVSATDNFDSSSFQYCDISGTPIFNSLQPNTPPLTTLPVINFSGPLGPNPFRIRYKGVVIFTDPNFSVGHDRTVDLFVNCGIPPQNC